MTNPKSKAHRNEECLIWSSNMFQLDVVGNFGDNPNSGTIDAFSSNE